MEACRELGLKFANAPYSPHSVADYTVMLMLMLTRKLKTIQRRALAQDYGFDGFQGREPVSYTHLISSPWTTAQNGAATAPT